MAVAEVAVVAAGEGVVAPGPSSKLLFCAVKGCCTIPPPFMAMGVTLPSPFWRFGAGVEKKAEAFRFGGCEADIDEEAEAAAPLFEGAGCVAGGELPTRKS